MERGKGREERGEEEEGKTLSVSEPLRGDVEVVPNGLRRKQKRGKLVYFFLWCECYQWVRERGGVVVGHEEGVVPSAAVVSGARRRVSFLHARSHEAVGQHPSEYRHALQRQLSSRFFGVDRPNPCLQLRLQLRSRRRHLSHLTAVSADDVSVRLLLRGGVGRVHARG
jgi:hypothetical protein